MKKISYGFYLIFLSYLVDGLPSSLFGSVGVVTVHVMFRSGDTTFHASVTRRIELDLYKENVSVGVE